MQKLTKDEMRKVIGGQQQRVACMECGGSIGTLCLAAPSGGACTYFESSNIIECTDDMNLGTVTFHSCADY